MRNDVPEMIPNPTLYNGKWVITYKEKYVKYDSYQENSYFSSIK